MIRVKIKIIDTDGSYYVNDEHLEDDYMISKQNAEFNNLIQKNIDASKLEEIDKVEVTAYFKNY